MNVLANFRDEPIRSEKVLRSAKGQPCSVRFPGICNGDPATTVWAHLNGAAFGKGAMIKAHDILGFHACYACHNYYDVGHGTRPLISTETLLTCILGAVCETYVRLVRAKIVFVPLDPECLAHDKPVRPRKPKADRKPIIGRTEIQSRGFAEGHRPLRSRNNLRKEPTP